jgi:hypothetical protein
MQVASGGYSPGQGVWLSDYYLSRSIFHLHYRDCASPKCSSGRCIWDLYFSLASSATKQVLTSYSAPPFCFFLSPIPHPTNFNIPEMDSNWTATTDTGTLFAAGSMAKLKTKCDCGLDSGTLSEFILSGWWKPRKPQYLGWDLNHASPEKLQPEQICSVLTPLFLSARIHMLVTFHSACLDNRNVHFINKCALICLSVLKCVISLVSVCRFRTCLKMADTGAANLVGKLFFNIVQTKCFVLKPEKLCVKRSWWGKCLKQAYKKQAYLRDNVPYWVANNCGPASIRCFTDEDETRCMERRRTFRTENAAIGRLPSSSRHSSLSSEYKTIVI